MSFALYIMKPIKLLNNYHDSQLESFSIGPRNEVTLNIHLDREGAPEITKVRFGAIKNFHEVQLFFSNFPNNLTEHYICEINKIDPYLQTK